MDTSRQLEAARNRLQAISKEIEGFAFTVSSSDLENDPNYAGKTIPSPDEKLTLTQLNSRAKEYKDALETLNKLWIIRGIIKEIQISLQIQNLEALNSQDLFSLNDSNLCGSADLEQAFLNLDKLQSKIDEFKTQFPNAIILNQLQTSFDNLHCYAVEQIKALFTQFFPHPNQFVNPIMIDGVEFEYLGEFVGVFRDIEYKGKPLIASLVAIKRKQWETELLDPVLIEHNITLKYTEKPDPQNEDLIIYSIEISKGNFKFGKLYFQSLASFIRFINLFQDKSLQNMYLSKISRNLTEMMSRNISKMLADDSMIHELKEVIDLAKRYSWSLSVNNTLGSTRENVSQSLNTLYIDWLTNENLKQIALYFKDADNLQERFVNVQQIPYVENGTDGDEVEEIQEEWNDNWEDDAWNDDDQEQENQKPEEEEEEEEEEVEEDDFLNEEWGWDDEEATKEPKSPKGLKSPKKTKTSVSPRNSKRESHIQNNSSSALYQVTGVPRNIADIVSKYISEGFTKDRNQTLQLLPLVLTAVTSLSGIVYPALERSFFLYNDLTYLHKILLIQFPFTKDALDTILDYTELSFTKLKYDLIPTLNEITLQINLNHDDGNIRTQSLNFGSNESGNGTDNDDYELDDKTLDQLSSLHGWFSKFSGSAMLQENPVVFSQLLVFYVDYVNNWITNSMISMSEITEYQSLKVTKIIESVQNITVPIAIEQLGATAKDEIKSIHRLENTKFLINNHLKEIMERFYSGEFYDYETNELISVIKGVFMESTKRANYIEEIEMTRNMVEDEDD